MNKIYHIELDDYSTPAFVSFGKNYYGTMEDIEEFITKFKDDENDELVKAFQEYKDGNRDVEITVAYRKRKMLEEVKVYGSKEINSGSFEWEHTNVWGFPYYLRCESLNSLHFWIKNGVILYRVIKARFTNLQYKNTIGEWTDINAIWGFPHIIEFGMYNTLMVVEKKFDTVKELKKDMQNFTHGVRNYTILYIFCSCFVHIFTLCLSLS